MFLTKSNLMNMGESIVNQSQKLFLHCLKHPCFTSMKKATRYLACGMQDTCLGFCVLKLLVDSPRVQAYFWSYNILKGLFAQQTVQCNKDSQRVSAFSLEHWDKQLLHAEDILCRESSLEFQIKIPFLSLALS